MSLQPDPQPPPAPWGPVSTVAWTLVAIFLSLVVAAAGFVGMQLTGILAESIGPGDGEAMTFIVLCSVPLELAILIFASRVRRWPATVYLGFVWPRRSEAIVATVAVIALALALLTFNVVVIDPGHGHTAPAEVEKWRYMSEVGWLFWYVVANIVAAPIGEEVMFRGFLFRGLARGGWEIPAIGATAMVWALLHTQYDRVGMAEIFIEGLILGWFRWRTGSTILTIGMHILINAIATFEAWIGAQVFL